jgi:hypothetical protein
LDGSLPVLWLHMAQTICKKSVTHETSRAATAWSYAHVAGGIARFQRYRPVPEECCRGWLRGLAARTAVVVVCAIQATGIARLLRGVRTISEVFGIDPNTQVQQAAWALGVNEPDDSRDVAPGSDDILGVALGDFDPESVQALYKSRKLATSEVRGYTLYACGNGASCSGMFFLFLDSNTLAFGRRGFLERMLAVRSGEEEGVLANQAMFPLIQQANGEGIFWGVLNPEGTRMAIRQLVPEASQFPESGKLLARMKALVVTIRGTSSMDADVQMISDSPQATTILSQILQAGLVVRRYEASQGNSALAQILDSIEVAPNGNHLDISFSISNDQANLLIAHNLFSMNH